MRTSLIASTNFALTLLALAGIASAHPEYEPSIPNRVAPAQPQSCDTCHGPGDTTVLNSFGNEVSKIHTANGADITTWWKDLQGLDSDNDGQTNGQELGDPCGTWKAGLTAPRLTDISNPGDPLSKSLMPHVPSCPVGGGGGAGGMGAGSVAAATAGPGPSSGPTGTGTGMPTSGAGQGDAPPTVQTGACASIAPTESGGAVAAAWLALTVVALKRRRR